MNTKPVAPTVSATPHEDEDPVWGDFLAEMFGIDLTSPPPAGQPGGEERITPGKPARKRSKKG
jgi:hypothetical protein